ncbi:unnamed protein product, partial [Prorocentrum cordatum]
RCWGAPGGVVNFAGVHGSVSLARPTMSVELVKPSWTNGPMSTTRPSMSWAPQ